MPRNEERRDQQTDMRARAGAQGPQRSGIPPAPGTPGAAGAPGAPLAAAGHPMPAAAAQESKKDRRVTIIVLIVCVLVVAAIGAGIWFFITSSAGFYDGNSIVGQAPYKTDEEIQAELDRKVEEGMLNISIASVIDFKDGTSAGTAFIENVPSNKYVIQVDMTLEDTGETIYQSGGLKPDSYIKDITLTRDLDPGTYQALATFHALDPDTLDEVGSAVAQVTLNVAG